MPNRAKQRRRHYTTALFRLNSIWRILSPLLANNVRKCRRWDSPPLDSRVRPSHGPSTNIAGPAEDLYETFTGDRADRAHHERGREMLDEIIEQLQDVAKVEKNPSMEGGKSMTAVLTPKT